MRTYYGVNISRYTSTGPNCGGMRWEAYVGGRLVKADTLAGIKAVIREEMAR